MNIVQIVELVLRWGLMLITILGVIFYFVFLVIAGKYMYQEYTDKITYLWEKEERRAQKKAEREAKKQRREFWGN